MKDASSMLSLLCWRTHGRLVVRHMSVSVFDVVVCRDGTETSRCADRGEGCSGVWVGADVWEAAEAFGRVGSTVRTGLAGCGGCRWRVMGEEWR